jgi:hypothetical protein
VSRAGCALRLAACAWVALAAHAALAAQDAGTPAKARPGQPAASRDAPKAPDDAQEIAGRPLPPSAAAALRVRITVHAIAATKAPGGVDSRLQKIAPELSGFAGQFAFRSYKLLDVQTFELDWNAPAQMELPGSRSLQVTPQQLGADGRIKVNLEVLGEHPAHQRKLHTQYTIKRGGTLLVGGYALDSSKPDDGTLLLAITQAVEK